MKNSNRAKTLTLVQMALLSALVVVLQLFFSAIRVGAVTLNFVLVPIVIAGVFIGPMAGLWIGALAGLTTFIQVFTSGDMFYVFLMTNNAAATAVICILKTAAAGWLSGMLYKAAGKISKYRSLNVILSAVVCPIVNTGLFVLGMVVFFGDAFFADATFGALAASSSNILAFVITVLVGVNFFVELALNVIVCPVVAKALFNSKVFKKS